MSTDKTLSERSTRAGVASLSISAVQRSFSNFHLQRSSSTASQDEEDTEETHLGLKELYAPAEAPAADFIFVHGLRGGSIKTWRKYKDSSSFWPKAWFPLDEDLSAVRTSSFGYQSDWFTRKESIFKLHDFGRKLLGDLQTSPYLRRSGSTPIVLIGHSMGGLVIKQAYLLAHQESSELATRIRSIVFLATPHRGSDSADLLHDILGLTGSQKPFVDDLMRNSPSLQQINDSFCYVADDLKLWSFWEERKMRVGLRPEFVVGRDSATLGYKHEKILSIDANHREICKFESPEDRNYRILRNCLVTILDELRDKGDQVVKATNLDLVRAFLNADQSPDASLEDLMALKTPSTCEWIQHRTNFRRWLRSQVEPADSPASGRLNKLPLLKTPVQVKDSCQIYWLTAQPGAGKSVCSAHVITSLRSRGYQCSYFFFQDGIRSNQTLNNMLRSIAFQMADHHQSIRTSIKTMQANGVELDNSEEAIWRDVFVSVIFKTSLNQPQAWVLDGLDECIDGARLPDLLRKTKVFFTLRIFIASRPQPDLTSGFTKLSPAVPLYQDSIKPEDTQADIQRYLSSEEASLDVDDDEERTQLERKLLARSNGCFLWVRLVRSDLEGVYLEESIDSVLDEIPEGMTALYDHSLASIARRTQVKKFVREKELVQALLLWAVCARRPLSLTEFEVALKFDSNLQVRGELRKSIAACGNLLHVDRNDYVQLIHSTLREFLFDPELESDFAVNRQTGHERLAKVCLKYMEQTMRPPRSRSFGRTLTTEQREQPVFEEYTAIYFSEHIAAASSTSDSLLVSVCHWLNASVLSWIEYIASQQANLYSLTRTARNFKRYLERRTKYEAPLGGEFKLMHDWTTDIVRLVAKFGRNLKDQPSSIFFLIPSIAPRDSMLYSLSLNHPKWLELTGSANAAWDDCVSFIEYRETYATALACGKSTIAIGMKNGAVILYDQTTCQEKLTVLHQIPETFAQKLSPTVRLLALDAVDQCFASAGLQSICVWSITGQLLRVFEIREPLVNLLFSLDERAIIAVTRSSKVSRLLLVESEDQDLGPQAWLDERRSRGYVGSKSLRLPNQAPLAAAISSDQTVLALLYRGKPIYLYNLEDDDVLGSCGRDSGSSGPNISVLTALFNPSPGSGLFAVSHQDGDLALYDSWTQRELASVYGDAYSLAATPDGQTLASGNTGGTVRLWDFETLTLLYVIRSGLEEVRSLAFTGDGSRLVDRRDTRIKVWEPSALIRKSAEEDASLSEAITLAAPEVGENDETMTITAMCCGEGERYVFAGRSDGSVVAFDLENGDSPCATIHEARNDTFAEIMSFAKDVLAVANSAQTVQVWKISPLPQMSNAPTLLMRKAYTEPIQRLFLRDDGHSLLISTSSADEVLDLANASKSTTISDVSSESSQNKCWATIGKHLAVIRTDRSIKLYDWTSGEQYRRIYLNEQTPTALPHAAAIIHNLWQSQSATYLAAASAPSYRSHSRTQLVCCRNPLLPGMQVSTRTPATTTSLWNVRTFLGVCQEQIVFLDHDLWICSLKMDEASASQPKITKHIFIPPELVSAPAAAKPFVTIQGHLVFSKEDKLAVIKGALDWSFG